MTRRRVASAPNSTASDNRLPVTTNNAAKEVVSTNHTEASTPTASAPPMALSTKPLATANSSTTAQRLSPRLYHVEIATYEPMTSRNRQPSAAAPPNPTTES